MRRPRLELPGIPLHITHRGVNRGATFIDDEDFASYLQALEACSKSAQRTFPFGLSLQPARQNGFRQHVRLDCLTRKFSGGHRETGSSSLIPVRRKAVCWSCVRGNPYDGTSRYCNVVGMRRVPERPSMRSRNDG